MKQPPDNNSQRPFSDETKLMIVLVLMGLGILLLITLIAPLLRGKLQLQPAQTAATAPATSFAPAIFVPTVDCGFPTLILGLTTFQIQNIRLGADGSVNVPPDGSGIAYWVEGTDQQYIFMLSPTPENLTLLTSLSAGTTAKATWSNCNSMTFTLSDPQPGDFETTYLPDQSTASIAIYVQLDSTGEGFVVNGELIEEQISTFETPIPGSVEVQAEIGLLEMTASPDGEAIRLMVSIYNYGSTPFTVTANDVSLTPPGIAPLAMSASEPTLPSEVGPAETKTFTFTFPRPQTPTTTLRVFTVEYDVEGY